MIQKIVFAFIALNLGLFNAVDEGFKEPTARKIHIMSERNTTIEHGAVDRAVISIPFYGIAANQLIQVLPKLSAVQLGTGIFTGWLLADLVSGIVHAVDDMLVYHTFTDEAIPVENFIRRNDFLLDFPEKNDEDDHHRYPTIFTKKSYWYTARIYHLMAFPMLGATYLLGDYALTQYILLSVNLSSGLSC